MGAPSGTETVPLAGMGALGLDGTSTGGSWGAPTGPFTGAAAGAPGADDMSAGAAPGGAETGDVGAPELDGALAMGDDVCGAATGEPSGELTGTLGLTGTGDTGFCSGVNTGELAGAMAGVLVLDGAATGRVAGAGGV
jgi:hypothetical protein